MAVVKLAAFSGEQPRVVSRLLPPSGARAAVDARLDDGALTPYRSPTLTATLEDGPFDTIYRHGETWLGFAGTVDVAPGPVAEDRLYYTGDGAPKIRVGETVYDLAVPFPTTAPTAAPSGTGDGDVQSRIYVYTFVTEFGEESEPSPASSEIEWQPGQTVTLSGIEDAPTEPLRGITRQRFYRSQTGTVGTDLYFIAERDVSDGNFIDDVAVEDFAEPLPSRTWNPPPDDLEGLIALPNGMMAGFVGKRLYFSEPYRPHAWPELYVLTTDTPIIALAAAATTVWVLTEGFPYRVSGTTPDTMVMDRVEANLPCVNARGVVDLGHAIAWPSHEGLAVAQPNGQVGLASANLFSPREWRRLTPATMRAGQHSGRWIGSYSGTNRAGEAVTGSLIIDLTGDSFLIRSAVEARAWHHDLASGFLYFLDNDGVTIRQFDSPTGDTAELYWRSKQFVLPKPDTMGCILIETGVGVSQEQVDARQEQIDEIAAANAVLIAAGSVGGELAGTPLAATTVGGDLLTPLPFSLGTGATVGVYADGKRIAAIGVLDRVARLPGGFLGRIWEVDVFADITIDQITMARTVDEMKQHGGGP